MPPSLNQSSRNTHISQSMLLHKDCSHSNMLYLLHRTNNTPHRNSLSAHNLIVTGKRSPVSFLPVTREMLYNSKFYLSSLSIIHCANSNNDSLSRCACRYSRISASVGIVTVLMVSCVIVSFISYNLMTVSSKIVTHITTIIQITSAPIHPSGLYSS